MIREISEWWGRVEQRVQRIQPPQARRIVVAIVGFTVLLIGILMLVLPGPALVVIPAGLAILALEFTWAKRWLEMVKTFAKQAAERVVPDLKKSVERKSVSRDAGPHQVHH